MIYKTFADRRTGEKTELSQLGFGAMRLPLLPQPDGARDISAIDEAETEAMIDLAIKSGINYFDTAWGYHHGRSETVLGRLLSKYPRSEWYLADKFPGYDISNMYHAPEIFEEQLKRCGVDYFDFYLLHNVCEANIEYYLDAKLGIVAYLLEQKKQGRIKHLGFSSHGELPVLRSLLDKYGEVLEFGQLQMNYLDWSFQNAEGQLEELRKHSIPLWVMEPLRGGSLVKMDEEHEKALREIRPYEEPVGWAFRFEQTLPETTVVLSGMSSLEQLKQNIMIFGEERPLAGNEWSALQKIARLILERDTLPCTGCCYCMKYCPLELDIPKLLGLYNEHTFSGGGFRAPMAVGALPPDKRPSACVNCHSCEAVCPQKLPISDTMEKFASLLGKK